MSVVIPFDTCVARPAEDGATSPLTEHLLAVAHAAGSLRGDVAQQLAFVAGLVHDAGKCHRHWQAYIRGERERGPPHAPMGAALFAFVCARRGASRTASRHERQAYHSRVLAGILAVYGHHGALPDVDRQWPPWEAPSLPQRVADLLPGCDLDGMFGFFRQHLGDVDLTPEAFRDWLKAFSPTWRRWAANDLPHWVGRYPAPQVLAAMALPEIAAALIVADRSHAGQIEQVALSAPQARAALMHHQTYCRARASATLADGANPRLVQARHDVQDAALQGYRHAPHARIYTLLLPTGYGKTLTALRVGLESCAAGICQRVLYVAPYLSVLAQAAQEIADASGLEVIQHHHLSLAESSSGEPPGGTTERADDRDFDVLETWQAPVIATTFNQLFRAVFPRRAQETLRRGALQRCFVVIDEPQILDTSVWNLLLAALAALAQQWDCRVLLATATLPPTCAALPEPPLSLVSVRPLCQRYVIRSQPETLTTEGLLALIEAQLERAAHLAVVMNTVRDAVGVYQALHDAGHAGEELHCLTAMMLAGHKADVIRAIRCDLDSRRPVIAVCTQVLEAGVDLSFRSILRARPVFPSVVQVAGRANRHAEGEPAIVHVFPFAQDGGRDMRGAVYRDRTACQQTDRVLQEHPELAEDAVPAVLDEYFHRCVLENDQAGRLARFEQAALGQWSRLAELEPFGSGAPREDLFIPRDDFGLSDSVRRLLDRFAPAGPEELLDKYLDKRFRRSLSFLDRKRLSVAVRQFVVPVTPDMARTLGSPVNDWLYRIDDPRVYDAKTGLAQFLLANDATDASVRIL